jgi:hypothetical protein
MTYNSTHFTLNEQQFEQEVCSGNSRRIARLAQERFMKMDNLPINVRIYEKEYLD